MKKNVHVKINTSVYKTHDAHACIAGLVGGLEVAKRVVDVKQTPRMLASALGRWTIA
jgi:hypothetical protein